VGLSSITFVTEFAKERQKDPFYLTPSYPLIYSTVQSSVMQRDTRLKGDHYAVVQLERSVGSNGQRAKSENYDHEITVT
jgi:hypothetical protein